MVCDMNYKAYDIYLNSILKYRVQIKIYKFKLYGEKRELVHSLVDNSISTPKILLYANISMK